MSYSVTATSVKPAGTIWFADADPATFAQLQEWQKTLPGATASSVTRPTPDIFVRAYTFTDEAAYVSYRQSLNDSPLDQQRQNYNVANGITTVYQTP